MMDMAFAALDHLNQQLISESNRRADAGDLTMHREVNAHIQGIYEDNRAGRMSDAVLRGYLAAAQEIHDKYIS